MAFSLVLERVCKLMFFRISTRRNSQFKALAGVITGAWLLTFVFAAPANNSFAQAPSTTPQDRIIDSRPPKAINAPHPNGVYATYKPYGIYKEYGGNYKGCMTLDRAVWANQSKFSVDDLNRYLDREDKTRPPKDKDLARIGKEIAKSSFVDFRRNYRCTGLGNGHAFSGGEMCVMWTQTPPYNVGVIPSNKVITYPSDGGFPDYRGCDYRKTGGIVQVFAYRVCEHYGKTKLGLAMANTSTLARWDAHSFDTVCFFIKKIEVEANLLASRERTSAAIEKAGIKIRAEAAKRTKSFRFSNGNSRDISTITEQIHKENSLDFEIKIDFTTPEVGKKIVDLARADPESAAKYISWLNDGIHHETVMWNPDKKAKTVIGHGYNSRVFKQTSDEIKKDLKENKKLLDQQSSDYLQEKNAESKSKKFDAYIQSVDKNAALLKLSSAVDELVDSTNEKMKKADADAENRRRLAIKKRLLSIFD